MNSWIAQPPAATREAPTIAAPCQHRGLRWLSALAVSVVLVLTGCAPGGPTLHAVSGSVKTADGAPCEGALVVFHPKDGERVNDRKPFANCGADGSYLLTTDEAGDGAEAGSYGVTVVWIRPDASRTLSLSGEGGGGRDVLRGRYGKPAEPPFEASVAAGGENRFDFVVEVADAE